MSTSDAMSDAMRPPLWLADAMAPPEWPRMNPGDMIIVAMIIAVVSWIVWFK